MVVPPRLIFLPSISGGACASGGSRSRLKFETMNSACPSSEVQLDTDLEEPRRRDRQRIEIPRPVGQLVPLRRIRVEQVENVEAHQRLGVAVRQDLAQPKIDRIQAIAVLRAGLDDVHEVDGPATRPRPPEICAVY